MMRDWEELRENERRANEGTSERMKHTQWHQR